MSESSRSTKTLVVAGSVMLFAFSSLTFAQNTVEPPVKTRKSASLLQLLQNGCFDANGTFLPFSNNGLDSPPALVRTIPTNAVNGGFATIDAVAVGDAVSLLEDLNSLGLLDGVAFGRLVSGKLPVGAITAAESLSTLLSMRLALSQTNVVGATANQADTSMFTNVAHDHYGVDGIGLSIGILSDSYDSLGGETADIASGDLPMGVNVLEDLPANVGSDEGRAMAQLIHDVAPGASLLFHTAMGGEAAFAQGILDLQTAGADIIVDDVGYFTEPYFQDGVVAQAVDTVVDNGAVYFSAAGNDASQSYEVVYNPASAVTSIRDFSLQYDSLHDFDSGPGVDSILEFTIPAGTAFNTILQWDQPFASSGGGGGGAMAFT